MISKYNLNVLDDDFDEKVNRKYKINNKPIRLGLVGSTYVHYKGHDLAIEALSILLNKGYDITLDFVGQGLSDNVKEMISKYNLNDRVYYKGVINSRNKMDEWYKSLIFTYNLVKLRDTVEQLWKLLVMELR